MKRFVSLAALSVPLVLALTSASADEPKSLVEPGARRTLEDDGEREDRREPAGRSGLCPDGRECVDVTTIRGVSGTWAVHDESPRAGRARTGAGGQSACS